MSSFGFSARGGSGYSLGGGGGTAVGFDGYLDVEVNGDLLAMKAPEDFSAAPRLHQVVINGRIMRLGKDYFLVDGKIVFADYLPPGTALTIYYAKAPPS